MSFASEYSSIFEVRRALDKLRQSDWEASIEELLTVLAALRAVHPYELQPDQLERFLSTPSLNEGPCGHESPGRKVLYRLCSVRSIVQDRGVRWRSALDEVKDDYSIWRPLEKRHRETGAWLHLSTYAEGALRGFRNLTWWTTAAELGTAVLPTAHKLGIPNNWVPLNALILRLTSTSTACPKVPTPVDGFFSLIFQVADGDPVPATGTTIDISAPARPCDGLPEIVIGEVPVESITFVPVLVDRAARTTAPVRISTILLTGLLNFYRDALEGT